MQKHTLYIVWLDHKSIAVRQSNAHAPNKYTVTVTVTVTRTYICLDCLLSVRTSGSVIGPQQQFLEVVERAKWSNNRMILCEEDTKTLICRTCGSYVCKCDKDAAKRSQAAARSMASQISAAVKGLRLKGKGLGRSVSEPEMS